MLPQARLTLASIPSPIIQRDNNGPACFYCSEETHSLPRYLKPQSSRLGFAVDVYYLLKNYAYYLLISEAKYGPT